MATSDTVFADASINPAIEALPRTDFEAIARSGMNPLPGPAAGPGTHAAIVNRLLEHPALWRAGQLQRAPATHSSGFAELDAHLPGSGWPETGLAELLLGTTGIGELRVLAPLIRTLSREQARWIAWINPPFTPYAPALEALGIDLDRMLVINPRTHQEALWALEQTSRSGSCSLALAWFDERQLQPKDTRRLQFAAQQGQMLTCLFRPESAATTHSMAELRMRLAPAESGSLALDIRKRRGGWPVSGIRLQIDESEQPQVVQERLSLWRRQRQRLAAAARLTVDSHECRRPSTGTSNGTGIDAVPAIDVVPPVTH